MQPAVARKTFRPGEHITRRADFEAVYASGVKVSGRLMTVFVRQNDGERARLGIAATRKIGSAVTRNRAKRLTREVFRTQKPAAALDVVVVPRREFLDAPYSILEREFSALLERAARSASQGIRTGAARPRRARGARRDSRV
jgi:ribonuclease P protein component